MNFQPNTINMNFLLENITVTKINKLLPQNYNIIYSWLILLWSVERKMTKVKRTKKGKRFRKRTKRQKKWFSNELVI